MDRWERIENKLDKIDDKLETTNEKLGEYNAELKIHIEGVKQNRSSIKDLAKRISPIEHHYYSVKTLTTIAKWLGPAGVVAIGAALIKWSGQI